MPNINFDELRKRNPDASVARLYEIAWAQQISSTVLYRGKWHEARRALREANKACERHALRSRVIQQSLRDQTRNCSELARQIQYQNGTIEALENRLMIAQRAVGKKE